MVTIKVTAIGYGVDFNQYTIAFEFTSNLDYLTEHDKDELTAKARRIAKEKSACAYVRISDIKFIKEY
jgi:hypothetical protein